jgi:hypothetical protein
MEYAEPERPRGLMAVLRPDEGWLSLILLVALAFLVGWSIADARWVLGRDERTSFLIWAAVAAALWGYLSARLEMSPWVAHTLGAAIGAFVVIECVGSTLPGARPSLDGWFLATADSVTQAYLDLTWRHQLTTLQYGHYSLVLGILVWGTAQAAAYDVFGYRRAVNGVLLLGVVLVANMSLTRQDQFSALVLFCMCALLMLLLTHAADERASWIRHRIWRGKDTETPHLRGGVGFASITVCAALVLTTIASSSFLQPVMQGIGGNFEDLAQWLSNYLPGGGNSRIEGSADFGSTSLISSTFRAPDTKVFTVRVPDDQTAFHWRMVVYDTFRTNGWSESSTSEGVINAGSPLDRGTLDYVTDDARVQVSITVHIQEGSIKHLVVANEPVSVTATAKRTIVGKLPNASVAWYSTDADDYSVRISMPNLNPLGAGLTEWRLRHAGTTFPPELLARFTQGTDQVGADGRALLSEIEAWAEKQNLSFDNEYNVAKAIQGYLLTDAFVYNPDIRDIVANCSGISTVDCFARFREGFCEQYATTMTMLMRLAGYPARYAVGYLPGPLDPHTMIQQITRQQQHAWVEVYFPTYGWVPFDPTGGSIGVPTELPAGSAVSPSPTPSSGTLEPVDTFVPGASRSLGPDESTAPVAPKGGSESNPPILPILAGVLAAGGVALWLMRPRRLEEPEVVYRRVVRLASRMGYRPHPTQTVYEYTGMLADVAPNARDPLGVVATAAVEVTYARRRLGTERLTALASAHELIRKALLRLAFKLPRRKSGGSQGSRRR